MVIGGGVIGVSPALFAARARLRVLLLEKGPIAAEQSSRNWGWIRVHGRDPAEVPVMLEAQRLWRKLDGACGGRLGLREVGTTYLARDEAALSRYRSWCAAVATFGLSSRFLDRRETMALINDGRAPWVGALHTPADMKAEPRVAVPELCPADRF